jgi:hypothetical protein
LREEGAGPVLESEQLLKVFFAENGTKTDLLATLAAARTWAEERNRDNLAAARAYQAGAGPFQRRAAQNQLVAAFLTDFYAMIAEWAGRAGEVVNGWPDDVRAAQPDPAVLAAIVERASWSDGKPPYGSPRRRTTGGVGG